MPTFAGNILDSDFQFAVDVFTSANLSIALDYYTGDVLPAVDESPMIGLTTRDSVVQAPSVRAYGGHMTRDYGDDWYNRIHVIPSIVNLGTITSDREVPVSIWNAYLTSRQITAYDATVTDGVTATVPDGFELPYDMKGLEITPFLLSVSTLGPSQIDATFDVTVDGVQISVPVTGVRSAAFYFAMNWKQGALQESFEANSWVIRAASGSEQSGSVSGSRAIKRTLSFPLLLSKKHAQAFSNMVFAWQDRSFGVPHRAETTYTTSPIGPGSAIIPCDTTHRSFRAGGSLFIWSSNDLWETRSIKSVTANSIELTTPLSNAWEEDSRVCPLLPGFIDDKVATTWLTSGVMRASVTFTLDPFGTPSNLVEAPAPATYNGYELYLGRTNWREDMPVDYQSTAIRMDKRVGRIRQRPIQGFSNVSREHLWFIRNRQDARLLREFVARRRGVARRVYMPTGLDDFTLLTTEQSGSSTIDVGRNVFAELIGSHPARRHILVLFNDGTYLARRIESATDLEGGVATRLNLGLPHGREVAPSNVKQISFLHLYRFAANRFMIKWATDDKGEASAEFIVTREDT